MAIVYRSVATAAANNTCSAPSGVASGDIMVATVAWFDVGSTTITVTPPSGWTEFASYTALTNPSNVQSKCYWKLATGSEPSTYTFSLSSSPYEEVGIIAYSGVDTTTPIDVSSSTGGTSGTVIAASVTTTVANTMLVGFFHDYGNGMPPPSGMTERANWDANINLIADEARAATGATGTRSTATTTHSVWNAHLVALKPAGGGPVTRDVAGSMPAPTGALTYSAPGRVSGTMGAPSGTLSRALTGHRTLTGSQPSPTGVLSRGAYDFSALPGLADGFWFRGDDLTGVDGDPITTWEDSGSGNHDATQATGGAKPTLRTGSNGFNGLPVAEFDGGDYLDTGSLFDSSWDTAMTVYIVAKRTANANNVCVLSVDATTMMFYFANDDITSNVILNDTTNHYNYGRFVTFSSSGAFKGSPPSSLANDGGVGGFLYDGVRQLSTWNGDYNAEIAEAVEDATDDLGLSGAARIGQRTDNALSFTGLIAEIIVCKAAHSAEVFAETQQLLREKYALALPPQLIFAGDSLTRGQGASSSALSYPAQTVALLDFPTFGLNQGVDASGTVAQATKREDIIDPYVEPDRDTTLVYWGGTNDIGGLSAATIWTNIQDYCADARTANPDIKIIGLTMVPRSGWSGGNITDAQTVNASIVGSGTSVFDAVVDLTTSTEFSNFATSHADTDYYVDGIHLTDDGYAIVAARVASAYGALAGPVERSVDGAMGAPSATIVRTLGAFRVVAGTNGAPSATVARRLQALRTAVGSQPAATGALARIKQGVRALTGANGAPSGVLTRTAAAFARGVVGTAGAPSGVLARTYQALRAVAGAAGAPSGVLEAAFGLISRAVAGVMGAPAATLTRTLAALRTATGSQPAATGVLARSAGAFARAAAGVAGAPSATLARVYQTVRTLAGSMPTATGALEYARDLVTRSLAGVMGAPSGAVSRQLAAIRTLAGSQPAATGILARTAGAFTRVLAGAMATATGLLTRTHSAETTAVRGTAADAAYGAAVAADRALVGAAASDSEG